MDKYVTDRMIYIRGMLNQAEGLMKVAWSPKRIAYILSLDMDPYDL